MAYPDFNADENYLISYVKSDSASTSANPYMRGYVLGGCFMFGFGVYHASIPVMVIAFTVVVAFRLYEEWHGAKWAPIWRAIVEKFEAALKEHG